MLLCSVTRHGSGTLCPPGTQLVKEDSQERQCQPRPSHRSWERFILAEEQDSWLMCAQTEEGQQVVKAWRSWRQLVEDVELEPRGEEALAGTGSERVELPWSVDIGC